MGDRVERLLEVHKAHIEWLLVLIMYAISLQQLFFVVAVV